ncbi:MAG: DUF6090 family protein [Verrucomicrobia bacterium]|nr:DUF6090 family protein [Verrucomicrobiota bacterium]MDA1069703.1 DUF6090 family protein [Verrucomicrobiota bacterium]
MLTFLRKIRRSLIETGSVQKYLLYAIGEIALVVIGILIALQINNWNEERKESILEQEYLARLEVAFEENAQLAERAVESGMEDSHLLEQFIQMTPEEAGQIPPDLAWEYLRALWRPNQFSELNNAALTNILNAGQLSVKVNPQLLTAFAEWRAITAKLAGQNNKLQDLDQEVTQPLSLYPELQQEFSKADRSERSGVQLPGSVTRRIREDNEVISRAARKGQASRVLHGSMLPRIQQKSQELLELIRQTREN